jgi:hypothetical protein
MRYEADVVVNVSMTTSRRSVLVSNHHDTLFVLHIVRFISF